MDIRDFVGERCLLSVKKSFTSQVEEFKVLEVSPSGNWVKLQNLNGQKFWKAITEISFVEALKSLKARPEN